MDTYNARVTESAKTIYNYCRARTNSHVEAEDLAQDIIVEILKSRGNLRDENAFYAFMWAVAGNVYKNWCKKQSHKTVPLDENTAYTCESLQERVERAADTDALRRELAMLSENCRRATVMYYYEDKRVAEIAQTLGVSVSMVKYLLFKARKTLKEGLNMAHTQNGDRSFNPGKLTLNYWGNKSNVFSRLTNDNLIAQNILLSCYNDRCTVQDISLQMGVAVPYLEHDIKRLCEYGVLLERGGKYETSLVIFTKEFYKEAERKNEALQQEIAEIAADFITGATDDNLKRWQIATRLLYHAIVDKYQSDIGAVPPKTMVLSVTH